MVKFSIGHNKVNLALRKTIGMFLIMCLASFSVSAKEEAKWLTDWEAERSEDNITSQCRKHHTKILQCRFNTVVDASFDALTAVVMDVENFKEWAVSVMVSDRVVYDEQDTDVYVYTSYHFTGASDRDALTRYRLETSMEGKRNRVNFITVDKPYEVEDLRLVRFPLMAGYWQFTKLENGKVEIEHQSFTLPGGVVQSTLYPLFNIGYLDASFDTMRAIQKQAKKPKYQNAGLSTQLVKND